MAVTRITRSEFSFAIAAGAVVSQRATKNSALGIEPLYDQTD
jgi:hypothetical protein